MEDLLLLFAQLLDAVLEVRRRAVQDLLQRGQKTLLGILGDHAEEQHQVARHPARQSPDALDPRLTCLDQRDHLLRIGAAGRQLAHHL